MDREPADRNQGTARHDLKVDYHHDGNVRVRWCSFFAIYKAMKSRKEVPAQPEPVAELVPAKAPEEKKLKYDSGVQGPVTCTTVGKLEGVYGRYQHLTQGFRRGWEVTRELHKPHYE